MNHMHLCGKVLLADSVLRRRVEVELLERELLSTDDGRSVHDNLDRRAKVLKLGVFHAG